MFSILVCFLKKITFISINICRLSVERALSISFSLIGNVIYLQLEFLEYMIINYSDNYIGLSAMKVKYRKKLINELIILKVNTLINMYF